MTVIGLILLLSGIFSFLACALSLWLIHRHKTHFTAPDIQSKVVGILWMVPIYAVDSYISLLIPKASLYVDMLRDCYEAYVLYLFLALMLSLMGCDDDDSGVVAYLEHTPGRDADDNEEDEEVARGDGGGGSGGMDVEYSYDVPGTTPTADTHASSTSTGRDRAKSDDADDGTASSSAASTVAASHDLNSATAQKGAHGGGVAVAIAGVSIAAQYGMRSGREFLRHCKLGVLQYCLVRPLVTLVAILLDLTGNYTDGSLAASSAYLYFTVLLNLSVAYAFHTLFHFYHAFAPLLQPHNPLAKFLCIKFVIFFAFWQGVAISICVATGALHGSGTYSTDMVAATLQDTLICAEMFLVSVAHISAFSYEPFTAEAQLNSQATVPLIGGPRSKRNRDGSTTSLAGVIAADELYFTRDVRGGGRGGEGAALAMGSGRDARRASSNSSSSSSSNSDVRNSLFSSPGDSVSGAGGGDAGSSSSSSFAWRRGVSSDGSAGSAGSHHRRSRGGPRGRGCRPDVHNIGDGDYDDDDDDTAFGWLDDTMDPDGRTAVATANTAANRRLLNNVKFGSGWFGRGNNSSSNSSSSGSVNDHHSTAANSSSNSSAQGQGTSPAHSTGGNTTRQHSSGSNSSGGGGRGRGSSLGSMMNRNFATGAAIRDLNETMPVVVLPTSFKPAARGEVVHSDPSQRI